MTLIENRMWRPGQSVSDREVLNESWGRDFVEIETSYGRLVYLAGLRNVNSGWYEHYAAEPQTRGRVNRFLRQLHEAIFREWVNSPLEQKKDDIERYIDGLDSVNRAELIDAWSRLTPYKNLVPTAVRAPDREKHISDFEAILGLLKNVYGVASPDQDA